jgi:hypothetical protein
MIFQQNGEFPNLHNVSQSLNFQFPKSVDTDGGSISRASLDDSPLKFSLVGNGSFMKGQSVLFKPATATTD